MATVTTLRAATDGAPIDGGACRLASGTRIRVARGNATADVAVEHLRIGDVVVTSAGERRPIRRLGHRAVDCRRHPRPYEAYPVRIAADAFAPDRPARDLLISPGHSICVDVLGEVLVPAGGLINQITIAQVEVETIEYWHVEVDGPDTLMAENLPVESCLDASDRGPPVGSDAVDPDASPDAAVSPVAVPTRADFRRPFYGDGPLVEALRAQLAARAKTLGWKRRPTPLTTVHLEVDGRRIAARIRGLELCFAMPAGATDVWLCSPADSPSEMGGGSVDGRTLGVGVARIVVDEGFSDPRVVTADDPRLCVGFNYAEGEAHRWTTGRGRLPADLWDGCDSAFFLRVEISNVPLPHLAAPERSESDEALASAT